MELFDRPFRVLGIDDLGPITPPSGGCSYILHAECAFSHYIWLQAAPDNGAETWAKFLLEGVMFDLAGFPPILRSDRGPAFISEVVARINALTNTVHSFGSAYHPQSQGFVEARHQKINRILASYCASHPEQWSRWIPLAQWSMRATPLAYRSGQSPFEMITGMLPQGPIDSVFNRLEPGKAMEPGDYVRDLVENLSTTHATIARELKAVYDEGVHANALSDKGADLAVGDHVVLLAPPKVIADNLGQSVAVAPRLLPRCKPSLYKVYKKVGPQTIVLADPDNGSTELGFMQPVHISRVRKFELADLDIPLDEGPLDIELYRGSTWVRGRVLSQSATGRVLVKFVDSADHSEEWLDLVSQEYRWLYPLETVGATNRRLRGKQPRAFG